MFFEDLSTPEQNADRLAIRIKQLESQVEDLDKLCAALFDELKVEPQQLHAFLDNRDNFSDQAWAKLEELRQSRDIELHPEVNGLAHPEETKRKYAERAQIERGWIPMR